MTLKSIAEHLMLGTNIQGKRVGRACAQAVIAAVALTVGSIAYAAEYEVQGTIEQAMFNRGREYSRCQAIFTVYVRDCAWLIETTEIDGAGNHGVHREVGSTNGLELFELVTGKSVRSRVTPATNSSSLPKNAQAKPYQPIPGGLAVSNVAPIGPTYDYDAGHLWLMFASHCYFATNAANSLLPVYEIRASPQLRSYPNLMATWDLLNGQGSLPARITYFNYLHHGVPKASYVVTAKTNIQGVVLPLSFVFEEFGPDLNPSNNIPPLTRQAECTLSEVKLVCSRRDLLPELKETAIITDYRLFSAPTNGGVVFTYQTNRWLSAEKAFELFKRQSRPEQVGPHSLQSSNVFKFK